MIEHLLYPLVCERFKCDARYREGHLRVINALPQRRVLGLHMPQIKQVAKQISKDGAEIMQISKDGAEIMQISKDGAGIEQISKSGAGIVQISKSGAGIKQDLRDGIEIKLDPRDGTEIKRVFKDGAEIIASFEEMSKVSASNLCYEETVIWGLLINLVKCSMEQRLAMLERYVPVMDNWAVCDSYCANAKWMVCADKDLLWGFLQRWFDSDREFEVRFAVVVSMCYFLSEEWLERIFERVGRIDFDVVKSDYRSVKGKPERAQEGTVQGTGPYYVRMGVAWLLATALAKFPELTRKFATTSNLPEDVIKLYVRKARESFRTRNVSPLH